MEPIRVLHILHSMNRGGAENAIMNYYRHIDRDKVQFDFLLTAFEKTLFEDEIIGLGGKIFKVPCLTITHPIAYLKGVKRVLQAHKEYKIVHSHTSSKSFFPLLIAKIEGVPVRLCHSHNTKSESGVRGWIRNLLKFPLKIVATGMCACGNDAAKWLYGERAFSKGEVRIIPNVIEIKHFNYSEMTRRQIRDHFAITDKSVVLGSVARFSEQKNHTFIIPLFKAFHLIVPDSILMLVGDGELREEIKRQVHQDGLDDAVLFTGIVRNVNDMEQAMDFFLLPSINEGLPLSLIEAQVSGLHCFASEGVPREADKTGLVTFLPLERGPRYWAEAVAKEIGYERRSHIEEIRNAGYDAETSAIKLEQFYLEEYQKITR